MFTNLFDLCVLVFVIVFVPIFVVVVLVFDVVVVVLVFVVFLCVIWFYTWFDGWGGVFSLVDISLMLRLCLLALEPTVTLGTTPHVVHLLLMLIHLRRSVEPFSASVSNTLVTMDGIFVLVSRTLCFELFVAYVAVESVRRLVLRLLLLGSEYDVAAAAFHGVSG